MSTLFAFLWFFASIYFFWLIISLIWRSGHRGRVLRNAGLVFVASIGFLFLLGYFGNKEAQQAGFLNSTDQTAAKSAGITDPAVWASMREMAETEKKAKIEAEQQARAVEKKLAEEKASAERKEAEARAEAEKAEQARLAAQRDADCRKDLKCWGEEGWPGATTRCPDLIEKLAKWDFEWTDAWSEPKFSHYRWKDIDKGIVTYIGDKLKLQNGFGAWKHVTYTCDYDQDTQTVLDVSAF